MFAVWNGGLLATGVGVDFAAYAYVAGVLDQFVWTNFSFTNIYIGSGSQTCVWSIRESTRQTRRR